MANRRIILQTQKNINRIRIEIIQQLRLRQFFFKTVVFAFITILLVSFDSVPKGISALRSLDKTGKWVLTWSDEFNYTGLPDTAKWNYEEGFVRNQELQYYTKARKENARVENGFLVIEARKEKIKNPGFVAGSTNWKQKREFAEYSSASINTRGRASFTYGRIETRIQVPHGGGVWPAFWTLGEKGKWPANGEIDILEQFGGEPNHLQGTVHFSIQGKHVWRQGVGQTQGPSEGFHIYAIEWYKDRIDFYFDDYKYWSFPVDLANDGVYNAYRNPHFLLLNFALGGSKLAGNVDESLLPQKYVVDYVRVYKLK